jgi:hypothetical protein
MPLPYPLLLEPSLSYQPIDRNFASAVGCCQASQARFRSNKFSCAPQRSLIQLEILRLCRRDSRSFDSSGSRRESLDREPLKVYEGRLK